MSDTNLVLCEVTGKQVPADETVTLNGKRVCAEGKAILLERMKGGENEDTVLRPTVGMRFSALFVDGLVLGIPAMVVNMAIKAKDPLHPTHQDLLAQEASALVFGLIGIVYFIVMHGTKGQTLGKMSAKIKVVTLDGLEAITMQQSVLRAVWHQGPQLLATVLAMAMVMVMADASHMLITMIGVIPAVYGIVSIILALTDSDKQRAIHDRMGKTRVVRVAALNQLKAQA